MFKEDVSKRKHPFSFEVMSKIQFIFISAFLILLVCCLAFSNAPLSDQLAWTSIFILLLGIPHGAIDHVLLTEKISINKFWFYSLYLGLITINTVLWFVLPGLSLLFFLLVSAYHFGQSQLSFLPESFLSKLLFILWGISILSGLLLYNSSDIDWLLMNTSEFGISSFEGLLYEVKLITITSTASVILLLGYFLYKNKITLEKMGLELIDLFLVHASFYILPLLIGFTLYFIILHSLKVMVDEFEFLKSKKPSFNISKFIALLTPFSLLSFIGSAIIIALIFNGWLNLSLAFILLVLLSGITLPHSVVMEFFYTEEK
jgi:Brp/Blh family beta-carotene 15,15'-monooxygenase